MYMCPGRIVAVVRLQAIRKTTLDDNDNALAVQRVSQYAHTRIIVENHSCYISHYGVVDQPERFACRRARII